MNQFINVEGMQCANCQQTQSAAVELFHAVKETILTIPNPMSPVRVRLQAAIDLHHIGHVPKRPLPEFLQREAELVGAGMDSESLEMGDFA